PGHRAMQDPLQADDRRFGVPDSWFRVCQVFLAYSRRADECSVPSVRQGHCNRAPVLSDVLPELRSRGGGGREGRERRQACEDEECAAVLLSSTEKKRHSTVTVALALIQFTAAHGRQRPQKGSSSDGQLPSNG